MAQEKKVPAFAILSDATLVDMCSRMPSDEDEFLEVSGVDRAKLEAYGKVFLGVINGSGDFDVPPVEMIDEAVKYFERNNNNFEIAFFTNSWGVIMQINTIEKNDKGIAIIHSSEILITDVQSALDFIATVRYETGCDRVILNKSAVCEDFFHLSTRLAGEILQKFINYYMKIAVIGDFSVYTSKSLKDFIYESNNGKDIFFLPDEKQAIEKLSTD